MLNMQKEKKNKKRDEYGRSSGHFKLKEDIYRKSIQW